MNSTRGGYLLWWMLKHRTLVYQHNWAVDGLESRVSHDVRSLRGRHSIFWGDSSVSRWFCSERIRPRLSSRVRLLGLLGVSSAVPLMRDIPQSAPDVCSTDWTLDCLQTNTFQGEWGEVWESLPTCSPMFASLPRSQDLASYLGKLNLKAFDLFFFKICKKQYMVEPALRYRDW